MCDLEVDETVTFLLRTKRDVRGPFLIATDQTSFVCAKCGRRGTRRGLTTLKTAMEITESIR